MTTKNGVIHRPFITIAPQIDDDNGGHFYHEESDSCRKCKKWRYDKKSCDAKNAAAAAEDCHQYNAKEMDKFCMKKDISQGKAF